MLNRIRNLAIKELLQLSRDWLLVIFIVLGPVFELTLLARTTSQSLKQLPIVIIDQDRSQVSRQLVTALDNSEDLRVVSYLDSLAKVKAWLDQGQAMMAIIIPAGLAADWATSSPQVQIIADGTNSMSARAAVNMAMGVISDFGIKRIAALMPNMPQIELPTQVRYNPELNDTYFTITAMLAMVVYQIALIVAVMGLTRERERGTLEQLLVTPLQRLEIIIGKAAPAFIVACVDFILMWAIAVWGYAVPMRGAFALLLGLTVLFVIAEIGWGLIISALSETQQAGALTIFVLAMIDVVFSGFVLPVDRMPPFLQVLSQAFPLQHYLPVVRSIMLKGATFSSVWYDAVWLVALAVVSIAIASMSLRRQMA